MEDVQTHPSAAVFPGRRVDGATCSRAPSPPSVAGTRRSRRSTAPDAVWVAVSHGDVIKAILADALGIHLDPFQRIMVDPASLSVVRYTAAAAVRGDA